MSWKDWAAWLCCGANVAIVTYELRKVWRRVRENRVRRVLDALEPRLTPEEMFQGFANQDPDEVFKTFKTALEQHTRDNPGVLKKYL